MSSGATRNEEIELGDVLLSQMRGGLLILTMNRPESRNAMDAELCSTLADQLAGVAEDRGVRAVILTGAGKRFPWVAT